MEAVFPTNTPAEGEAPAFTCAQRPERRLASRVVRPRVVIPVYPGTNGEYDARRAFEAAGAKAQLIVVRNRTPEDIEESVAQLSQALVTAQMLYFSGGFSAGDEPDGSGKFIAATLRNPRLADAVHGLLDRDGLILGICNGFQALIKVGLLPHGRILETGPDAPTLTFNAIGRLVSRYVHTRVASVRSPWLLHMSPGEICTVPVSHGEGRFVASPGQIEALGSAGQIAFQYADDAGTPTMASPWNPNGSAAAVEGLISPDGRVLGKMGHSERVSDYVAINIPGQKRQPIFESGVAYFA